MIRLMKEKNTFIYDTMIRTALGCCGWDFCTLTKP